MLNLLQEAHPFTVSIPHACVTVHAAECLHGMWMPWDNAKAATFFPQPIGLAATWDTDFMEEVAGMISDEMRAINNEQYKQDKTYRYCVASGMRIMGSVITMTTAPVPFLPHTVQLAGNH